METVDYRQILATETDANRGVVTELGRAVLNGYVDRQQFTAASKYAPRLLTNQFGNQIYDQIKTELNDCEAYTFAVAFITDAMLSNLKPTFKALAARGVRGRLLTSTYLCFNSPKVFRELLKIPGLTVRLADVEGFHQKGYIYEKEGYQTIIIGSANLTTAALMKNQNYEWSLQVSSLDNGEIVKQVSDNIEAEWQAAQPLRAEWIDQYVSEYQAAQPAHQTLRRRQRALQPQADGKITPNAMQKEALGQIQALRDPGSDRGLVVSATGTGKTYLAAFDALQVKPQRLLFVAHREEILRKSLASFQKILGGPAEDYGLLTGSQHDWQAKYLFATVQTLAKEKRYSQFTPDAFDYILVDEVHHAGGATYQTLLNYFKPAFFLGMTATPERNDDFNIFELFNYQVAYEIRLQDALEEGMLCPFHYVGVQDFEFSADSDQATIDEFNATWAKKADTKDLTGRVLELLSSHDRVAYILQATEYYGYSGDTLHGLVFCASVAEAEAMATEFTRQDHPAVALSGADSIDRRSQVVGQLERGEIDYIVTVDIFNEGIDIPCVNQVVFLRNTNSSIVYIQQLGRGLRKAPGKDYVEVIDFIGNYQNNYMIPIALTGDDSFSKDNARKTLLVEPTVGLSTISFEAVAKEKIYQSLREIKLDEMGRLKEIYHNIKQRVGRVPLLQDFYRANSIDPVILANKEKNYARFLKKVKAPGEVNEQEDRWLTFLAAELLNGKRPHELVLLRDLLKQATVSGPALVTELKARGAATDEATLTSMRQVLTLQFFSEKAAPNRSGYGGEPLISWEAASDQYRLNDHLKQRLQANEFFARLWADGITTGLLRGKRYVGAAPFVIGEKYTRKDSLRLINHHQNLTPLNIGGYVFTKQAGLIFITYDKVDDIRKSIAYKDRFLDEQHMHYYSKNNRRLDSKEIAKFCSGDYDLHMFVQKSGAEDNKTFYYLGTAQYVPNSAQEETLDGKPLVSMNLALDHPVSHQLYELFTKDN